GIAGGIKGIVEAAEKAGEEGKLESEEAAGGNENAGKLFAKKADATNGGDAAAAEKAATAVVLRGLVKLLTFFQLQLKFFCFHLLTFKTIGILFIESFGFKAISSFYIFFFFRNFSL
ncbi:variable large family protein, partial [Borreliella burgdorferi]